MTLTFGAAVIGQPDSRDDAADLVLRDLGPLVVQVDGQSGGVGGAILARTLSMLLVHANRLVPAEVLERVIWGEGARKSSASLETHIWRLRKLIEPNRASRQPSSYLVNEGGGYRLILNPDQADSTRFAQLARQGDDFLASGVPQRALGCFEQALGLWRGRPFDAVADDDVARAAVDQLEQLRDRVEEQRVEALLQLGAPDRALPLLETLVSRLQLREPLWAQLMLALYRCGRPGDALSTYLRARDTLLDEVGVEPGSELRRLQARILEQDPSLDATRRYDPEIESSGLYLPARLSPLIGREVELVRLAQLVPRTRLTTVVGAAGCGKTRLSIEVARQIAAAHPDGTWFVDLTAIHDGAAVADTIASTIGLSGAPVGGPVRLLRSYFRDRRVLVVLDNCEHLLSDVRDVLNQLLFADTQARVLATSREPIGVDGELLWTLAPLAVREAAEPGHDDGYRPVARSPVDQSSVDQSPVDQSPVKQSPAAQLFWSKAEAAAPQFQRDGLAEEQAERLCAAVDGIPLAIELAAGRMRTGSLREIFHQVQNGLAELSRVGHNDVDHHRTVDLSIDWSVRLLAPAQRMVHARLSVLPGTFTQEAAVAVAGHDPITAAAVPELLQTLTHCSLLEIVAPSQDDQPTRFRQLATVRSHAARALSSTEQDSTVRRRTDFVQGLLADRPDMDAADEHGWEQRTDDNHDTVTAVLQHTLVDDPDPFGARLAGGLRGFWMWRGRLNEGVRWMDLAVRHPGAQPADRMEALLGLSYALVLRDRSDLARPLIHKAIADGDHLAPRSLADGLMASAYSGWLRQDSTMAFIRHHIRDMAGGDPAITLYADLLDTMTTLPTEGPDAVGDRTADLMHQALELGRVYTAWLCGWVGLICAMLNLNKQAGLDLIVKQGELHRLIGARPYASVTEFEGAIAILAGDNERGLQLLNRSRLQAYREGTPWPLIVTTDTMLSRAREAMTTAEYEQAWRPDATTA